MVGLWLSFSGVLVEPCLLLLRKICQVLLHNFAELRPRFTLHLWNYDLKIPKSVRHYEYDFSGTIVCPCRMIAQNIFMYISSIKYLQYKILTTVLTKYSRFCKYNITRSKISSLPRGFWEETKKKKKKVTKMNR